MAEISDRAFIEHFLAADIPQMEWKHRDHIKVAFLFLKEYPYEEALSRMRDGIRNLNASHGVTETAQRGYHETMTVAWLRLVDAMMRNGIPAETSDDFCNKHPQLLCKHVLHLYYSPDRLRSDDARGRFVAPDIAPLPG